MVLVYFIIDKQYNKIFIKNGICWMEQTVTERKKLGIKHRNGIFENGTNKI